MNKLAERIAGVLGSAWVIGLFGAWTIAHIFISRSYVATISDLAIEIGFLILRAENTQSERQEKAVKEDVRLSKKVLKLLQKDGSAKTR